MNKPRILVVDDEQLSVELFEGMLSKDYDVVTAYDGSEALLKVEKTSPDLVLLDIMMPGMSGYEVCRQLKNNDKTISIPIVVITALKEKEDRIKAIEAGADDFLSKPVDIDELRARVKSLLRVKQYYDNLMFASKAKSEFLANKNRSPQTLSKPTQRLVEVEHPILKTSTRTMDIVKNHLEIIILSMLAEKPMCGLDLIKEIFEKYNVLLSLGTVYPFLYSLKEESILQAELLKNDKRKKIYSVTQEGKQIIEKRIDEFTDAEEYFLNSIRKRGSYV